MQDLSKEQAESHKVLVQPALEVAANATVSVLQQLIKNITEQVCHWLPPQHSMPNTSVHGSLCS